LAASLFAISEVSRRFPPDARKRASIDQEDEQSAYQVQHFAGFAGDQPADGPRILC
jgi:hypothetical protein